MNILITGISRGIGLALTRQALEAGHHVIGVARTSESKSLLELAQKYGSRLNLVAVDLRAESSLAVIAAAVEKLGTLDVLVNNAGIMKRQETIEDFNESFLVNATLPLMITRALIPFLKKAQEPRVVQISTLMGSIADNSSGGYYSYRSSKAALNMLNRSLAIDNPEIRFLSIHPGWVQTDMGGAEAPVTVEDSAKGIWQVVRGMDLKQSGQFKDFRGKSLPW